VVNCRGTHECRCNIPLLRRFNKMYSWSGPNLYEY